MKKEEHLNAIAKIKAEAMQIDLILEERKKKICCENNGSNDKRTRPFLKNQMNKEDQENIDVVRKNGYKGQN
jgi:hypothetical protein